MQFSMSRTGHDAIGEVAVFVATEEVEDNPTVGNFPGDEGFEFWRWNIQRACMRHYAVSVWIWIVTRSLQWTVMARSQRWLWKRIILTELLGANLFSFMLDEISAVSRG